MLRRRPLRVERTVIMGLLALASLQLLAVSQEKGWQFSLVADHEGGILGALSPDMNGDGATKMMGAWSSTRSLSRAIGRA